MYFQRSFSTVSKLAFKKESVAQFAKSAPAQSATLSYKWGPTQGKSFRSFAEYRLKVAQQSPLSVRSKNSILGKAK